MAGSFLHHPFPLVSPAGVGGGAGFWVLCRLRLCWEVGEAPKGLGAHSWAGWTFLGSFSLKPQILSELLLLFSLFLSPFCLPPLEKTLCGIYPPGFSLFPMEVLGLSNPAAPSLTSGSHGPRPPLPPALAFTRSFELAPCQGGNDGFGVSGVAEVGVDDQSRVKDGFISFLLLSPP